LRIWLVSWAFSIEHLPAMTKCQLSARRDDLLHYRQDPLARAEAHIVLGTQFPRPESGACSWRSTAWERSPAQGDRASKHFCNRRVGKNWVEEGGMAATETARW